MRPYIQLAKKLMLLFSLPYAAMKESREDINAFEVQALYK